jgi:hypothetical protein
MSTKVGVVGIGAALAGVLLSACGSSTPQACSELAPAVEDFNAMRKAFLQDPTSDVMAGGYNLAIDKFAQTALGVANTASAREEGIDGDLRDLASMLVQGKSDSQAAGVAGIVAIDIDKVCGFTIFEDVPEAQ